jgi:hypothetical protein
MKFHLLSSSGFSVITILLNAKEEFLTTTIVLLFIL